MRYDQKMAKYHGLADQNGFHFAPAAFSHTGQLHDFIKRLILKTLTLSGHAKQSRVKSTMSVRWWTKRVSMMIAKTKTASRNIAFKADMMSQAVLEVQTPEARGLEASSERHSRDDDDVERNADSYVFNH